ncbi:WD40 repeat domain-containing protein [Calidithermus chliarophilus]|uniref:WD40 repeat domain-containing protein n=1 Tax=Calidithermus chliarophilus TaxID=52023 RepID=UPI0012F6964D|nr:WD40 repeat domain-containing protein [Calidithermus chliarophilus]
MLRFFLGLFIGVTLNACNPGSGSDSDSPQISFEVRIGSVNFDPAVFGTSKNSYSQMKEKWEGVVRRLKGHKESLFIAETTEKVNFWVSFLVDGKPPASDVEIMVSGSSGEYDSPLVYAENLAWDDFILLPSLGLGEYQLEAKYRGVSKKATVSLTDASLGIPQNLSARASNSALSAIWDEVPGAESYIYLIYDLTAQEFVYADAVIDNQVGFSSGSLNLDNGKRYELWLIAASWNATVSRDRTTVPPKVANMSVTTTPLIVGQLPLEGPTIPPPLLAEPGGKVTGTLELKNPNNSPVSYAIRPAPDAKQVALVSGGSGVVPPLGTSKVEFELTCLSNEGDQGSSLIFRHAGQDAWLPLYLKCYFPPQITSFKANRTVVNAGDPAVLSWQTSGSEPRYLTLTPYNPPYQLVVSVTGQSEITLWPTSTTEYSLTLTNPRGSVTEKLTIDVNPLKVTKVWEKPNGGYFSQHPFSASGQQLAIVKDGILQIIDTQTGNPLIAHNLGANTIYDWSPTGEDLVYYSDQDKKVHVINALTGFESNSYLTEAGIGGIHWGSNGKILMSTYDNRLIIWSPSDSTSNTINLQLNGSSIQGVPNWSPDASKIALGDGQNIRILDGATGSELKKIFASGLWISWSPDGKLLATKHGVLDAATGNPLASNSEGINSDYAAFLPDGVRILAGKYPDVLVYSAYSGQNLWRVQGSARYGATVAISPDGTLALLGWQNDGNGTVEAYRVGYNSP